MHGGDTANRREIIGANERLSLILAHSCCYVFSSYSTVFYTACVYITYMHEWGGGESGNCGEVVFFKIQIGCQYGKIFISFETVSNHPSAVILL